MIHSVTPDMKAIIFNIIGGIIVAGLSFLYIKFQYWIRFGRFKRLFGPHLDDDMRIVYGKMVLKPVYDQTGKPILFPYCKPDGTGGFRVQSILADTEANAIKYISDSFSRVIKRSPKIASDQELLQHIDLSFISVGGLNNEKSSFVLHSNKNEFYEFGFNLERHCDRIISKIDGKKFFPTKEFDYALIIKIRPTEFPSRVQFCVAGIGEEGTRGASYLLGNKWKEVLRKTKGKEFGMLIKVNRNYDELATIEEVHLRSRKK